MDRMPIKYTEPNKGTYTRVAYGERIWSMRDGYVYCIVGFYQKTELEKIPVIKIGITNNPHDRFQGIRSAFRSKVEITEAIYKSIGIYDDALLVEEQFHKDFASARVNEIKLGRDWYLITPAVKNEVLKIFKINLDGEIEMSDYIKMTKTINSDQRITIDDTAMDAAGAEVGDTVEVLFKVIKKKTGDDKK